MMSIIKKTHLLSSWININSFARDFLDFCAMIVRILNGMGVRSCISSNLRTQYLLLCGQRIGRLPAACNERQSV